MKKNKKIIIIVGIIVGIIALFMMKNNFNEPKNTSYDYLVFDAENNAYLKRVASNFEIEVVPNQNFNYEVMDEEGKKIATTLKKKDDYKVICPKEEYEKGKTYTLTITNGVFKNELLKDKQKLVFTIKKDEVSIYSYRDEVENVSSTDLNITNNILQSNDSYDINDIVIIDNQEAYKIVSINEDKTYNVSVPNLNELFTDINIYQESPTDLSNFKINKELEDYLVLTIKESEWYDELIETVDAEPKIEIKSDLTKASEGIIKFKVAFILAAQEKGKPISGFDNHNITFELELELRANSIIDWNINGLEAYFQFDFIPTFEFKIDYYKKDLDSLGKDKKEELEKFLKKNISKLVEDMVHDKNKIVKNIGTILVPFSVPGLNFEIEFGLLFDFDIAIDAGYRLEKKDSVVFGFNFKNFKEFETYGSYNAGEIKHSSFFGGEGEIKVGLEGSAGLSVFNIIETKLALGLGLYGKGEFDIKAPIDFDDNAEIEWRVKAELGFFTDLKFIAKCLDFYENEMKIAELKKPFKEYNISNKETNDEPVSGEVKKLTAAEIKAYYDLYSDEEGEFYSVYFGKTNTNKNDLTQEDMFILALRKLTIEDLVMYDYAGNVVNDPNDLSTYTFKKETIDKYVSEMFGESITEVNDICFLVQKEYSPIGYKSSCGNYNENNGLYSFQFGGIGSSCGMDDCSFRISQFVEGYQKEDKVYLVEKQIYILERWDPVAGFEYTTLYKDYERTEIVQDNITNYEEDYYKYILEGETVTIVLQKDSASDNYYFYESYVE